MAAIIKKLTEKYKKPTPGRWRLIGDSILGLGTVVTAITAITSSPWIPVASAAITWLGKTITNFASEDDSSNITN
jgi:hypothetical protein